MKILTAAPDKALKGAVAVIFLFKEDMKKSPPRFKDELASVFKERLFKGAPSETLFLPTAPAAPHLLLSGLGPEKDFSFEAARKAAGAAIKALSRYSLKNGSFFMDELEGRAARLDGGIKGLARAAAEGAVMASFQCLDFKHDKKKTEQKHKMEAAALLFSSKGLKEAALGAAEGAVLGAAVNEAKRLASLPGNFITPAKLAEEAQKLTRGNRIKTEVWGKARIQKEKMGGLWGVAKGSAEEPRFIIMSYKGAPGPPVVFAGKGVTFDSGGISIKPSPKMDEMKFDMCGAAAVIAAMRAIEKLKLKVHAAGLVAAAENMPDGAALKPGDIIKARNGKTMEILNTDAEGRLLLADALSYASEMKPQAIFDAATLTGAILSALSNIFTGFFTKSQKLRERIESAGLRSGERLWPLPLVQEHLKDMKSQFADIANCSSVRGGGSSTAAAFLEFFVDKKIPYAHFDIAGTAWNVDNRLAYCAPKSASGVIVRTFVEIARSYEAK